MRKPFVIILICLFGAIFAVLSSMPSLPCPHALVAVSWLSAILALGVFAIMIMQHIIHQRLIYLYIGAAYLALGIMGIRESLIYPSQINIISYENGYFPIWQLGWITLAAVLIYGIFLNRSAKTVKQQPSIVYVTVGAVIWAAFIILLTALFPYALKSVFSNKPGLFISVLCFIAFVVSAFMYSRYSMHRNNNVIIWLAYSLIFAALAQLVLFANINFISGYQFAIASILKVLAFITPIIGMLAEHTRLQLKLHNQSNDFNHLTQIQKAVTNVSITSDLYQSIVDIVSSSFDAGAVCLMPFDNERSLLYIAAMNGFDENVSKQLVFRSGEGNIGECFSRKEQIFVQDVFSDYVMAQKLDGVTNIGSAVYNPLMLKDNCLGVLAIFYPGKPLKIQKLPKDDAKMLDALSNQAALALDMHQMRNAMMVAAKATDDHARELEIVAGIGRSISSELEIDSLVDTLSENLKSVVGAQTCTILVFDPDIVGVRIMGRKNLIRHSSIKEHEDICESTAAMVAQTKEPVILNDIPNSRYCKFQDMNVDDDGTHHMISVPMHLPGFFGAINIFRQNAEPFGEREKRIMIRLAPIVASSIRNADLYGREKRIAENLQQSFLPDLDKERPDIEVQSHYLAAYDESLVGGDFYDVIDFADGRYGVVIGDVSGKGLDAAVYTAMTRYMIEAYSFDDPNPKYVISKLNNALCKYTPVGKFVTVFYGIIDPKEGTFCYVNAGHELPFLRRNNSNKLETLKSSGPAVGALLEAEYKIQKIPFNQGDVIVLYTDGATDARNEDKFLGTDGLHMILANHLKQSQGDITDLPKTIMNNINEYANGYLRDDVAILAVKSKVTTALF